MRAAFVAVMGGRQVAVLVPTTLLAEQHFNNFSDRFAEWPIKVAEISRFRTAKEQAAALKGLENGDIDIIIGTHRLIQKDVKFKNLGLVILDEEHRFGVRQKEQLKALRAEVDVLTLTATPIPRTLSMAMEGLREFSVITTPPQKRLSIKTFHTEYSEGIIREAAMREFKRGGQVYFLHNEVDTIHSMREKLERILPDARIGVAHGQLRERELEHVMRDFYHQRFNLLLCTTIIETGIDVPTANTITAVANVLGTSAGMNQTYAGATYDFGILKAYAQYINRKVESTLNSSNYAKRSAQQIGVRSYITPTIEAWASAGLGRVTTFGESTPTANFNGWQLGSNYYLSKRTNLYAIYGQTLTSTSATNAGVTTGGGMNNYAIGARHTF